MSDEQFLREAEIALRVQIGGLIGFLVAAGLFAASFCVCAVLLGIVSGVTGEVGNAMYHSAERRWNRGAEW